MGKAIAPKERYFEDFVVGEATEFGDYLVTEAEIVDFARRYDPQPFHLDSRAAQDHGGLIASGWHTAAIVMRLKVDHYIPSVSSMASPGVDEIRWKRPVRAGDRLRVRIAVIATRAAVGKPDRGMVQTDQSVLNQTGEVVMTMKSWGIYRRRMKANDAQV